VEEWVLLPPLGLIIQGGEEMPISLLVLRLREGRGRRVVAVVVVVVVVVVVASSLSLVHITSLERPEEGGSHWRGDG